MKLELKRLVRLTGCGALLAGGVVLAQDAAPAPAAPPRHEISQEAKDLRASIEAKEKAVLAANAELKQEVEALDAQIKTLRNEGTAEARKQSREIAKQRQEKIAAVDPELKDLYAKQNELMRKQFGGRGQGGAKAAAKPANP